LYYKKDIGSGTAGSPIFLNIEGLYSLIGLHYGNLVKQNDINHNKNMLFNTPDIEKFQCGLRVTDEMLCFVNLHT
jgi:V8-like Glu-specific endopeptidase